MKTEINRKEKSKHMENSEQTVKLVTRVIEDLINNKMGKGASFAHRNFMNKEIESLYTKGVMR